MIKDTVVRGAYPLSLFTIVTMGIAQWENPFLEHKAERSIAQSEKSKSDFGNCKTKLNSAVSYCPNLGLIKKNSSAEFLNRK